MDKTTKRVLDRVRYMKWVTRAERRVPVTFAKMDKVNYPQHLRRELVFVVEDFWNAFDYGTSKRGHENFMEYSRSVRDRYERAHCQLSMFKPVSWLEKLVSWAGTALTLWVNRRLVSRG